METLLEQRIEKRKISITEILQGTLKKLADSCSDIWNQVNRLDQQLVLSLNSIPKCRMLYAVECHGIQVSSNIKYNGVINHASRGQNLSDRPYFLNSQPDIPFTLSPVYISRTNHKPCITALHQVFSAEGVKLGCIAADFVIDDLPDNDVELMKTYSWKQIKGDPAIRQNLFQQKRIVSAMDEKIEQVHDIIHNLITQCGIFHAKMHYSSSRATLWAYAHPYEYQLHVLDEIIDPNVCLAYPSQDYPEIAKVDEDKVAAVLKKFTMLRDIDDIIYLRAASINVINGMVGLTFSCDGSHYMSVEEFLDKQDVFWFG
ncbi:MAG: Unknown protein [uncultured Thiotrichaceae bacterium]|uniref:Uncharacterized protein n=1 Tax=uncultured Thiotrichaceae bacterium TaxID=298394 RepID=A0A6S6STR2_9GAMM|nr:MAG: Unknown protein [uncultured Thiotrichaceae bacterium]